jgi:hypothetical protein
MTIKEVRSPPKLPNLEKYKEVFGHRQSPEATRAHSPKKLDEMAKASLETGKPITQWRDRHKMRIGNSNDQRYEN